MANGKLAALSPSAMHDVEMRRQTKAYVLAVQYYHPDLSPPQQFDPYPALPNASSIKDRTLLAIAEWVAHKTCYSVAELRGNGRSKDLCLARAHAYDLSSAAGWNTDQIGRFYNRDGSTVRYWIAKMGANI